MPARRSIPSQHAFALSTFDPIAILMITYRRVSGLSGAVTASLEMAHFDVTV